MTTPGPVLTEWRDAVTAVLAAWMPGQEFGNAIVDVLLGDLNPSAKLTHSMPNSENDRRIQKAQWPGIRDGFNITSTYTERLEVGYRWYHANNVVPAFPFGHGLSYTSFKYTDLEVDSANLKVSFGLENVGGHDGAEVGQLYLSFPASAGEPPRQLKGFHKQFLAAGAKRRVTLDLTKRDFSIWDVEAHDWQEQSGEFLLEVGSSSADIRLATRLVRSEEILV